MDILGRWVVEGVLSFDEDFNRSYVSIEEYLNSPYDDDDPDTIRHEQTERRRMCSTVIDILADGTIKNMMVIPEDITQEELDESGMEVIEGKYIVLESGLWKEEDGKYFVKAGHETDENGVTSDHYEPMEVDADGYLYYLLMLKMKRA